MGQERDDEALRHSDVLLGFSPVFEKTMSSAEAAIAMHKTNTANESSFSRRAAETSRALLSNGKDI